MKMENGFLKNGMARQWQRHASRARGAAAVVCFAAAALIFTGCGVYTFSGSTLPGYLKTVDIPVFLNKSLQPDIADEITSELNQRVLSSNLLNIANARGDATISGAVVSYSNHPYTYGTQGYRDVDVSEYAVKVTVEVEFMDNKKGEPLYRGPVTGEGVYNFQNETEEVGRTRAVKEIVDQIMQNSVQSW